MTTPANPDAPITLATDPHPDCQHEWHGADGGKCPGCGWDSHPIPCNVAGCDHARPDGCEIVRCGTCGEPYDGTEPPARHIARAHLDILARERFGGRHVAIAGNACCGGNGAEVSCGVCRRD